MPVEAASAITAAGEPEATDDVAPASAEQDSRARRKRIIAIAAAGAVAAAVVVVAVAVFAGGNDSADVSTPQRTSGRSTQSATSVPGTGAAPSSAVAGTTVTVNADVLFDVGSAELTPTASSELGGVLSLSRTDGRRHLVIEGYTDSDGDPTLNQQLSQARAEAVAQWLISQGIEPTRISVVGHGASNPIAANDTPEHKALNRRVVVTLQTA